MNLGHMIQIEHKVNLRNKKRDEWRKVWEGEKPDWKKCFASSLILGWELLRIRELLPRNLRATLLCGNQPTQQILTVIVWIIRCINGCPHSNCLYNFITCMIITPFYVFPTGTMIITLIISKHASFLFFSFFLWQNYIFFIPFHIYYFWERKKTISSLFSLLWHQYVAAVPYILFFCHACAAWLERDRARAHMSGEWEDSG